MKLQINRFKCPLCDSKDTTCYECGGLLISETHFRRIKRELIEFSEMETKFDYYMEDRIFGNDKYQMRDI